MKRVTFLIVLGIQSCFNDGGVSIDESNKSNAWFQNKEKHVLFNNTMLESHITNMMTSHFNYSSYNYAITKTVSQISHNRPNIALFVTTLCSTDYIIDLMTLLKSIRKTALCYRLEYADRHIFEDGIEFMHFSFISTAVLLLPWFLTDGLLKMSPPTQLGHVTFITVEMLPVVLDWYQDSNIFLKVINVESASRNLMRARGDGRNSTGLAPSFCTIIEKCDDSTAISNKKACYKQNDHVVRVVSLLYEKYVFILPGQLPINEQCISGLPCKVPIKNENSNSTTWQWLCCGGVYVEIFLLLFREMDLAYEFYIVEDGNFGAVDQSGMWNGMIGDLYRGHADLAVQQVTVLTQRFKVIDYTYRIITKRIPLGIVIRNLNSQYVVVNWSFINSLTNDLLAALCVATIIILVLVYTLENIGYLLKYDQRYPFRESFSHINGVLFQRDLGATLPRRWPGQIVSIVYAFGMTVTIGTYTAQLTANNIDIEESKKFRGFQDVMFQDPSFRVGVQGSSSYEYFLDKQDSIRVKKIVINNWREGIDMVYNKTLDAFIGQSNSLESMISSNNAFCENLLLYREDEFSEDMAFAVQKGSVLGERITTSILQYTENGLLEHIINKWSHINSCNIWQNTRFHQYPWQYGGGLAVILLISVAVCIAILFIEHLYTYLSKKRRNGYDLDRLKEDSGKESTDAVVKESSFTNQVSFSY